MPLGLKTNDPIILQLFEMLEIQSSHTGGSMWGEESINKPMNANVRLTIKQRGVIWSREYMRVIRKLKYLIIAKLAISFFISVISKFLEILFHDTLRSIFKDYPMSQKYSKKMSPTLLYHDHDPLLIVGVYKCRLASTPVDNHSISRNCVLLKGNLAF